VAETLVSSIEDHLTSAHRTSYPCFETRAPSISSFDTFNWKPCWDYTLSLNYTFFCSEGKSGRPKCNTHNFY